MARSIFVVVVAMSFSVYLPECKGQHCPPIGSSYLSEISLKSLKKGELTLRVEYLKTGGQRKDSYQFYVLAYLARDSEAFPTPIKDGETEYGDEMFSKKRSVLLNTSVAKRNQNGFYTFSLTKKSSDLAKELETFLVANSEKKIDGVWGRFDDQIRLAIFVPFLEDKRYANLPGLPKDPHECNYSNDRALLWQELPFRLSVEFNGEDSESSHIQIKGG